MPATEPRDTDAVCRNCGHPAGPRFCGHCGQPLEEHRGPFLALLGELLAESFSLDGKLLRSLAALARPGRLTRRYLEGKRAPYLGPFRLYAVASLLLFSSALSLQPPKASEVNLYIDEKLVTSERPIPGRWKISLSSGGATETGWFAGQAGEKIGSLRELPPQAILDATSASMRRVLPIGLILLLPFFALALKLLYLRTGTLFVDHLVFATHIQIALFLSLALIWLFSLAFRPGLPATLASYTGAALLVLLVYLPWALRRVYRQSRWLTGLKTAALLLLYFGSLQLVLGVTTVLFTLSL
jgi:Protein of unknown function (DUF3667)